MGKHENLYQRGRTWYYRFKMHGRKKPFAGSCFTHDLREAKRVLREKMAEVEAKPTVTTVATTRHMSLKTMCEWDFRRASLRGSRAEVLETMLGPTWRRLMLTFGNASDITADALASYALRHLEDGSAGPSTLKRDLWAAKRGYEYAQESDPSLPRLGKLPSLKKGEPGKNKGEVVPLDVAQSWFARLKGHAKAKAVVSLFTALRREELARYEPSWLSRVTVERRQWGLISVPKEATKGKKARTIVVPLAVEKLIRKFAPFEADPKKAWETASRHVGFQKHITMRDLRKTFASNLAPFDWPGTMLVMGHAGQRNEAVAMMYQEVDTGRLCKIAARAEALFGFSLKP